MSKRDFSRFIEVLLGKNARPQKMFMMGTVTQANPLMVRIDGDAEARPSAYLLLFTGWYPEANDRVLMANVNGYYVVLGKTAPPSVSMWHSGNLKMASGMVTLVPTAPNTPTEVSVSFPAGRFTDANKITPFVTASTVAPNTAAVSCREEDITVNGMKIYGTRTTVNGFNIFWLAVQI